MVRRIGDIEMLRGVAVIFVIVFHTPQALLPFKIKAWEHVTDYYFSFWPGVDLFFAISGFVIARTLLPKLAAVRGDAAAFGRTALSFWLRRAWRLLPSAWLWLAIIMLCCVAFNESGAFDTFHTNFESVIAAMLSLANFRFGWSFPLYPYGPSAPYWSLSLEEQFYAVLPVLAFVAGRRLFGVLAALLVLFFCLPETTLLMVCRVHPIILGVLLAMVADMEIYRLLEPRGLRRASGVIVLIVLLMLLAAMGPLTQHIVERRVDVIAILSALLVWVASYDRDYLWPPGSLKRCMLWVGSRSYALYLVHYPVCCATREIWYRLLPVGTVMTPRHAAAMVATAVPLLLGCAELNYRFVELPLRRHGAHIADRVAKAPLAQA